MEGFQKHPLDKVMGSCIGAIFIQATQTQPFYLYNQTDIIVG